MTEPHSLVGRVAHPRLRRPHGRRARSTCTSRRGASRPIVGANGCGKSTLLRALARLLAPRSGQVVLDGKALHRRPSKEVARTLGLLPQSPIAPEGIVVADLVGRGRHPHQKLLARWTDARLRGRRAVARRDRDRRPRRPLRRRALRAVSASASGSRWRSRRRPTSCCSTSRRRFLDVAHQVEVLDLLTDLNRDRGTTIVMVLHDLNLAARYADHLFAMRGGAIVAGGPPAEVMTSELIRDVFDLDALVVRDPVSGTPIVLPRGRHHVAGARRQRALPPDRSRQEPRCHHR